MEALGNGLRSHALLVQRVGFLMYQDRYPFQVDVDPGFEKGSLLVPVHILSTLERTVDLFSGKGIVAFATMLTILGYFGINPVSLYRLFQRLKGRRIASPEEIAGPNELKLDISSELIIRIYNDNEVQQHIRQVLSPLHDEGIEEFQTRRNGIILSSVSKADLLAADEAEVNDLTSDEEVELGIEKAAWRRNLAWHLTDGKISFDARIDDPQFWRRVEQGEPFAVGDRLRVHLRTTARRRPNGTIKVERRIPLVIVVEHARRQQRDIFDIEDSH